MSQNSPEFEVLVEMGPHGKRWYDRAVPIASTVTAQSLTSYLCAVSGYSITNADTAAAHTVTISDGNGANATTIFTVTVPAASSVSVMPGFSGIPIESGLVVTLSSTQLSGVVIVRIRR